MKVQKVIVEEKSYPLYILLDKEFEVIEPVKRFIKYLDNTGKAPNTIKTYCYHLKLFYEFMSQSRIELGDLQFEDLANFVGWLRNPAGHLKVIDIQPKKAKREETSVNSILNAVTSFLEYLNRTENFKAIDMSKRSKRKKL